MPAIDTVNNGEPNWRDKRNSENSRDWGRRKSSVPTTLDSIVEGDHNIPLQGIHELPIERRECETPMELEGVHGKSGGEQ